MSNTSKIYKKNKWWWVLVGPSPRLNSFIPFPPASKSRFFPIPFSMFLHNISGAATGKKSRRTKISLPFSNERQLKSSRLHAKTKAASGWSGASPMSVLYKLFGERWGAEGTKRFSHSLKRNTLRKIAGFKGPPVGRAGLRLLESEAGTFFKKKVNFHIPA